MEVNPFLLLVSILAWSEAVPVMTRQSLAQQKKHREFCRHVINFNNFWWYSPGDVKNLSGIPADLSVHWKSGKIFFTLISTEMKMNLQMLNPSGEFESVKVAGLGQSTTVDNLNDIVYLATDNGVYKYKEDGSIELYTAMGEDVMYLAVSSDGTAMYIATWPQNRVHRITNDGQKLEPFSLIPNGHGLVIDTRNNIYFIAMKTSYILKSGYTIPIKIKDLPSNNMTGVFVSRSDEVYAMDENSNLYAVDPDTTSARHLGCFNVSGVNSFAMDGADNIIMGVRGSILKFNAFEKNPCQDVVALEPKVYPMPTMPTTVIELKPTLTTKTTKMNKTTKMSKTNKISRATKSEDKKTKRNSKKRTKKSKKTTTTTTTTTTVPPTTSSQPTSTATTSSTSTETSDEDEEE